MAAVLEGFLLGYRRLSGNAEPQRAIHGACTGRGGTTHGEFADGGYTGGAWTDRVVLGAPMFGSAEGSSVSGMTLIDMHPPSHAQVQRLAIRAPLTGASRWPRAPGRLPSPYDHVLACRRRRTFTRRRRRHRSRVRTRRAPLLAALREVLSSIARPRKGEARIARSLAYVMWLHRSSGAVPAPGAAVDGPTPLPEVANGFCMRVWRRCISMARATCARTQTLASSLWQTILPARVSGAEVGIEPQTGITAGFCHLASTPAAAALSAAALPLPHPPTPAIASRLLFHGSIHRLVPLEVGLSQEEQQQQSVS